MTEVVKITILCKVLTSVTLNETTDMKSLRECTIGISEQGTWATLTLTLFRGESGDRSAIFWNRFLVILCWLQTNFRVPRKSKRFNC